MAYSLTAPDARVVGATLVTVPRPVTFAVGCCVALTGAAVWISWLVGIPGAGSLVEGSRVMVPATAFGFACVGVGLALFGVGAPPWCLPALAALAVVVPVATLSEYATGSRWGLENQFGVSFRGEDPYAGRMSAMTALTLVLLSSSLAALPWGGRGPAVVRLAAGTTLAMSWFAVLAVSLDGSRMADVPGFPGMAVLTIALLALSSVTVLASSEHALAQLRGGQVKSAIAPGTLALAFALPLLLGRARELLSRRLDAELATALVVVVFAAMLAIVVWQTLRRIQSFQTQRERLLLDLEARVGERTKALALANAQLQTSEGRLREADRRKDEFLATLAHELRNPLAPIRTGLEILKDDAVSPTIVSHAHQVIGRQMRHLVRLIDDLLDVSRITANKLDLRLEPVSVSEILHQSVETTRGDIDRAQHVLTLSLPPEPLHVLGDPTRLTQIVANLLQNACKYTPRGGQILLGAGRVGDAVELRVRDNGIGIAAASQPRLFEKFSQVSPAIGQTQGGLGLGLALVRGLVSLHGGVVDVHSDGPGQGSEFVVRLPVTDPAVDPAGDHPAAIPRRPVAAHPGRRRQRGQRRFAGVVPAPARTSGRDGVRRRDRVCRRRALPARSHAAGHRAAEVQRPRGVQPGAVATVGGAHPDHRPDRLGPECRSPAQHRSRFRRPPGEAGGSRRAHRAHQPRRMTTWTRGTGLEHVAVMTQPPRTPSMPPPASREAGLDETVEDSFPASDPPSTIPDPLLPDGPPRDEAPPPPRPETPARRWSDAGRAHLS